MTKRKSIKMGCKSFPKTKKWGASENGKGYVLPLVFFEVGWKKVTILGIN